MSCLEILLCSVGVLAEEILYHHSFSSSIPLSRFINLLMEHGYLHRLRGPCTSTSTSLYFSDAEIFVTLNKEDIQCLTDIQTKFANVTTLVTNFQKTIVGPMRWEGLDLTDILQSFPTTQYGFHLRYPYIGLPLSVLFEEIGFSLSWGWDHRRACCFVGGKV